MNLSNEILAYKDYIVQTNGKLPTGPVERFERIMTIHRRFPTIVSMLPKSNMYTVLTKHQLDTFEKFNTEYKLILNKESKLSSADRETLAKVGRGIFYVSLPDIVESTTEEENNQTLSKPEEDATDTQEA